MKRRSLVVFAGDSSKDSGSVLSGFYLWELCFSLVPLAPGEGSTPLAPFSPFSVPLSLSLISSPSSSFPLFCHLSFSLFPFLLHKFLPSLFFFSSFPPLSFPSPSSLPSSSALSFPFPSFFASFFCSFLFFFLFFFRELLVLSISEM